MEEGNDAKSGKEPEEPTEARAESPEPPRETPPQKQDRVDPYWWAPWAVLIGLVLYGLLGFLGVLTPTRKGPTAADVPAAPAPSQRAVPAR